MTTRWRALGLGFLLILPAAAAAGIAEAWFADLRYHPGALAVLYGVDIHVLLALVAVAGARVFGRGVRDAAFPGLAAGVWVTLELVTIGAIRLGMAPFLPPLGSPAGMASAAAIFLAGLAIGILLTRALLRRAGGPAWERALRGRIAVTGLVGIALVLAVNAVCRATPDRRRGRTRSGSPAPTSS
jgi:hypothetical protein